MSDRHFLFRRYGIPIIFANTMAEGDTSGGDTTKTKPVDARYNTPIRYHAPAKGEVLHSGKDIARDTGRSSTN